WLEKQCLSSIYSLIHEQKSSALCLSGGGIRSATFNLGILQGLARKRLIGEFDYLSTVSGGGYIGSWLTAWIHRHKRGVDGVMHELSEKPTSALEPDPPEVSHLRTYSNYLSPQTGLLSADTWTLAATVIRNLFLNWLVFIPLLLAVLMFPRIYVAAIRQLPSNHPAGDLWEPWSLAIGIILSLIGVTYVGRYLPSKDDRKSSQRRFLWECLLPMVLAAIAVTFFWARFQDAKPWHGWKTYMGIVNTEPESYKIGFIILVTLVILVGWAFYLYSRRSAIARYVDDTRRLHNKNVTWKVALNILLSIVIIIIAGYVTGYLLWKVSDHFRQGFLFGSPNDPQNPFGHARTYAIFAVPLLMALLMMAATLLIGLTSRYNSDDEQEWFARYSGWILIVIVGWLVVSSMVLSSADVADNKNWATGEPIWPSWSKLLAVVVGIVSGIITLVGGFSAKTQVYIQGGENKPSRKESQKGMGATLLKRLASLAAPIFFIFLIVVLSIVTNSLLEKFSPVLKDVFNKTGVVEYKQGDFSEGQNWRQADFEGRQQIDFENNPRQYNYIRPEAPRKMTYHRDIVLFSGMRLLIVTTILLGLFGWIMGLLIDTGKFSIHSMYANRLKRAYLGASRKKRRPNWFTNFDSADDLPIHELRPALFNENSFRDLPGLIHDLNNEHDQLSDDLRQNLSPTTRALMKEYKPTDDPSDELVRALCQDLNKLLDGDCIYVEKRHEEHQKEIIEQMVKQGLQDEGRILLNRLYLEESYPNRIKGIYEKLKDKRLGRPLPIVNIALNLMKGDKLAWQERKAETFTVSPLHSGNHLLGYRRSSSYGGERGITLGTAFTISGAAASPNMGYMISSPLVSFLMAMFNVRLGWWLGNPGPAGNRTFKRDVPQFAAGPVVVEALSMTDDKSSYVYLSDGGHFENLGLYEMVLRRCHLIVVSDASTDP
ncbi:MAG: patatin-like phospholipase family protein, partial [Acidobacteria bacterium]|nr:patatin-like phospholipase family protein [Acidobacteriota bacterium]